MKNIHNLRELLIEQSQELYDSIDQELRELPNVEKEAFSKTLRTIITGQTKRARNQKEILTNVLKQLDSLPEGEKSESTNALINEMRNLVKHSTDFNVKDASIINSLQNLNHRKISGFGTISAYAKALRLNDISNQLHNISEEEKEIDKELTNLAVREINKKAANESIIA